MQMHWGGRKALTNLLTWSLGFCAGLAGITSASSAFAVNQETFELRVDIGKVETSFSTLETIKNSVESIQKSPAEDQTLRIWAEAKKLAGLGSSLTVEVFIENLKPYAIDQVNFTIDKVSSTISSTDQVINLTQDAYERTPLAIPGSIGIGRLHAHGIKKLILGVKKGLRPTLMGNISYEKSPNQSEGQNSTNILVTPDGQELWAVSTETNEVVVYNLATKSVLKRIAVGSRPFGLAYQKSTGWMGVVLAGANRLVLIDQQSKQFVSTLGKGDRYGRELRYVLASQSEPKFYVSSYVEGLLTEITVDDAGQETGFRNLSIGPRPTGMSATFDDSYLYVAHFLPRGNIAENEAWLSNIDLKSFKKANETLIEDHFAPSHERMKCLADFYNSYPVTRAVFGKLEPKDVGFEGAASQLSGVFLDPSGQTAWVPGTRITGALVVLERGPNADPKLQRFGGLQPGQYVAPLIFPFDASGKGKLHEIYVNDQELSLPTLGSVARCLRQPIEIEFIDRKVLKNGKEQINPFLAYGIPQSGLSGLGLVETIGFTKGGRRVFMLSRISDEIAVYDGVSINPATQLHFPLSGSNPKGMAFTPDKTKAFVLYENSLYISEIDTSAYADDSRLPGPVKFPYKYGPTLSNPVALGSIPSFPLIRNIEAIPERPELKEVGQWPLVSKDPMEPSMRRGKILFSSANPEKYQVSLNRLGACASCHPDGGSDGSSWVTMEGTRRTLSLRGGVANRGWLHISGTHETSKEFVETVVPERLGGTLTAADTDALEKFVGRGIPKLQNPRVDLALAAKGEELFKSFCAGCHAGPAYTSGSLGPNGQPKIYNIGTGSKDHGVSIGRFANTLVGISDPLSKEIAEALTGDRDMGPGDRVQEILDYRQRPKRLFGEFKAPSLVNTFDYAIYFHDGSIPSLKQAIAKINDILGFALSPEEIDSLEAYLKIL